MLNFHKRSRGHKIVHFWETCYGWSSTKIALCAGLKKYSKTWKFIQWVRVRQLQIWVPIPIFIQRILESSTLTYAISFITKLDDSLHMLLFDLNKMFFNVFQPLIHCNVFHSINRLSMTQVRRNLSLSLCGFVVVYLCNGLNGNMEQ